MKKPLKNVVINEAYHAVGRSGEQRIAVEVDIGVLLIGNVVTVAVLSCPGVLGALEGLITDDLARFDAVDIHVVVNVRCPVDRIEASNAVTVDDERGARNFPTCACSEEGVTEERVKVDARVGQDRICHGLRDVFGGCPADEIVAVALHVGSHRKRDGVVRINVRERAAEQAVVAVEVSHCPLACTQLVVDRLRIGCKEELEHRGVITCNVCLAGELGEQLGIAEARDVVRDDVRNSPESAGFTTWLASGR